MRRYDYNLATKIISKYSELNVLKKASLGMHEDWYWSHEVVWEDGQWKKELMTNEEANEMYNEFIQKRKEGLKMFLNITSNIGFLLPNPHYLKYSQCKIADAIENDWATPVLDLELLDGSKKVFRCYTGNNNKDVLYRITRSNFCTTGFFSSKAQKNRFDEDIETFIE